MNIDKTDWVTVAILVPVATLAAVAAAKRLGAWLEKAITRTFAETVRDVVAPDLARMANRVGQSVDELREANTREHRKTTAHLAEIEEKLADNAERLAALEDKLARDPDSRTRSTDQPPQWEGT